MMYVDEVSCSAGPGGPVPQLSDGCQAARSRSPARRWLQLIVVSRLLVGPVQRLLSRPDCTPFLRDLPVSADLPVSTHL